MSPAAHAHFWSIADQAQGSEAKLRPLLEQMSREQMLDFYREYHELVSELLDALPAKTDAAEEIAWVVVTQGSAHYYDVKDHPEKFPAEHARGTKGWRSLMYDVFEERFDEEIMVAADED